MRTIEIEIPADTTHAELKAEIWNLQEGLTLDVSGRVDHPCRVDDGCPDGPETTHYHSVNLRFRKLLEPSA